MGDSSRIIILTFATIPEDPLPSGLSKCQIQMATLIHRPYNHYNNQVKLTSLFSSK